MLIKKQPDIKSSEITDEKLYRNRRKFIKQAAVGAIGLTSGAALLGKVFSPDTSGDDNWKPKKKSPYDTDETLTSYKDITTYNNYYEFGTDKDDPAANAGSFKPFPWKVSVEGEVKKATMYNLEDLLKGITMEDRIYRHRCVEAWSMVIPWYGFPLNALIKRFEPTSKAKFVEFTTVLRPEEMPGQRRDVLQWPYVEGLRMDEAMHPLTFMVTGIYGKSLLNQNGAPLRIAIPWKYGFKSCKSIVKIRFTENQPANTWNLMAPNEYGFYSNVNPEVDHPRWSQAKERRIGEFLKRNTLMFNGYGDQVAGMYSGMDLKRYF
ncbi:MAG: protein-methionine-sulfoxide reductase catalytic subunit MsrP [Bacteroidota bacterium]